MAGGKKHFVFPRHFVKKVGSRQKWYRECRVVRDGQEMVREDAIKPTGEHKGEAPKMVPMFAEWQTELYVPETPRGGIVPLGPLGRVELWTPGHLPPGTVHLPMVGAAEVAKKFGVHYAEAMMGFEVKAGRSYPSIKGIVVCAEFAEIVSLGHAEVTAAKVRSPYSLLSLRAL
jgi:xeroderma pigmentosum group C-complementing protein